MPPELLTLSLHGVTLEIRASDAWLAEAVEPCFAWLDRVTEPQPMIRVDLQAAAELPSLPADAEPQYHHFGTACYANGMRRWLVDNDVCAEIGDRPPSMTAWALDSARDEPGGLQGVVLTGVLELLREAELYQLHAGCVDRGGVGVLFCGGQGAGKTTATLAMARAGWGVVSDDLALLRRDGSVVEALEWRERMNVGRDTLVAFGLWNHIVGTRADGRYVADMAGEPARRRTRQTTPRHLLILARTNEERSVLRPVKRPEALAQLVRQSPLVLVGRSDRSEEHLRVLRDLAGQCECHELRAGRDVLQGALPGLVGDL